jgi:L-ascorbate metabolism protein UlaG (beta-lactamase superfamily)
LSHSHTDHVDPYTLIELFNNLKTSPSLLIPETLSFIVPLFEKHLNNPDIIILRNKQEIKFK